MAEHSVGQPGVDPAAPPSAFNDLGYGGWTGSNFYTFDSPPAGLVLIGGRIWIPPGLGAPWDSGTMPMQMGYFVALTDDPITSTDYTPNQIIQVWHDTASAPFPMTHFGWIEYRFPTPLPINPGMGVAIGWRLGDGNQYVSVNFGQGTVFAWDGFPLALSEHALPGPARGLYGNYQDNGSITGADWAFNGGWYGADIIIGSSGVSPALGGFEGAWASGPAEFGGKSTARGGFTSVGNVWGPAAFDGEAVAGGGFTGMWAMGPATFVTTATRRGDFDGHLRWGDAVFGGTTEKHGAFGGLVRWGAATFGGVPSPAGQLPPDIALAGWAEEYDLQGWTQVLELRGWK